jgi:hypothetical protein
MVRWNAGTEHVKTQRQTLSPAGPKIEILADGNHRPNGFGPTSPVSLTYRISILHRHLQMNVEPRDNSVAKVHLVRIFPAQGRMALTFVPNVFDLLA